MIYVPVLTLIFPDEEEGVPFTRVFSRLNPLIGAWILSEGDNINVLTFLSDTEYVIAHTQNGESYDGEEQQALSGEFGNYSLSGDVFTVSEPSLETNGDGGLWDAGKQPDDSRIDTLSINVSNMLRLEETNGEVINFTRVGDFSSIIPDAFSEAYLLGKTFYQVHFGAGSGPDGEELEDVAAVAKFVYGAGGVATATGLMNEPYDGEIPWAVNSSGLLYHGEMGNGNIIVCGSTEQYIKTHYVEEGITDNTDLYFFNETDALAYASNITADVAPCDQ